MKKTTIIRYLGCVVIGLSVARLGSLIFDEGLSLLLFILPVCLLAGTAWSLFCHRFIDPLEV